MLFAGATVVALASTLALGEPKTSVQYNLYHWEGTSWVEYCPWDPLPSGGDQPGTNLWKYEYVVVNISAPQPIRQVYTFFNSENEAMYATWAGHTAPTGWTGAQIGPFEPDYNWKERYQTTNSAYYIQLGQSLGGFSVEFTWTKPELPDSQIYDAVYSGGSESWVTTSACGPSATEPSSWGTIKALYR